MKVTRKIHSKVFLLAGVLQLVGILAIAFSPLVYLYLIGVALLIWSLVYDQRQALGSQNSHIVLDGPPSLALHSPDAFVWNLLNYDGNASQAQLTPKTVPVLEWGQRRIHLTHQAGTWTGTLSASGKALGSAPWGSCKVSLRSRWGFWTVDLVFTNHRSIDVTPPLNALSDRLFQKYTNNNKVFRKGRRLSLPLRAGDRVHTIREWRYPDPLRWIDQRRTAQFQKPMTRVFEEHKQIHMLILCDLGRSMLGHIQNSVKTDFYLAGAYHLIATALKQQDKVSFLAFADRVHMKVHHGQNLKAFRGIRSTGSALSAIETESQYELLPREVQMMAPIRSVVILLTDPLRPSIQTRLSPLLHALSKKHLVLVAGVVENRFDFKSLSDSHRQKHLQSQDLNEAIYATALQGAHKNFDLDLQRFGAGALLSPEDDWLGSLQELWLRVRLSDRVG